MHYMMIFTKFGLNEDDFHDVDKLNVYNDQVFDLDLFF
ncbi:hypothetical protein PAUR_a4636 [Pseudoalteromonas aurantia 208]|uniref:Uncharacterized protein n=1 Tax=Pseudoalteromonas aurantia 208 TaxID=1314867 RepID=A0ABR9EG92_9GAMM|nr:hypothetical protein [Pseudoalteromonas aurantia 208]